MADGNSQGISCVSLGNFRETEQDLYHLLHLLFFRFAVTNHRLFYLSQGKSLRQYSR